MSEISHALLAVTVAASITCVALPARAETELPADAAPLAPLLVSEPAPQSASDNPQGAPPVLSGTLPVPATAVCSALDGGQGDFDAAHSVDRILVGTDEPGLLNRLYADAYSQAREPSELSHALDVAAASNELHPGKGSRVAGSPARTRDFWSAGVKPDRSGLNFRPANGLLQRDLLDTRGATTFLTYYTDVGPGPIREIKGDMSLTATNPAETRQQRLTSYAGGSIESRAQVRAGVWYTDTPYRPVSAMPGSWSDTLNHDRYWTGAVDFNTRSSRFAYGAWGSSGSLGGGDYAYLTSYAWARPTATTFLMGTSEHVSNFGTSTQAVASAGWDFTRRQSIVGRYMNASYGKAYQVAYSQKVRKNIDFFLAFDRQPAQLAALSAKIVITLR